MRVKGRWLLLITLLGVEPLACRSPLELCGNECSNGGQSGAPAQAEPPEEGGAPARVGGSSAGEPVSAGQSGADTCDAGQGCEGGATNAGGAAGEPTGTPPECTRNDDCSDGKGCNGVEECLEGRCEPGQALACPNVSECFESQSGASCRYPESERFVVYTGDDFGSPWYDAVAVPITRLGDLEHLNFSEGVMDEEFRSIFEFDWSPDGRRLIFPTTTTDWLNNVFDQKYFWVDLVGPRAGQARRLPNIRINDTFFVLAWSPASNVVIIGDPAEMYAVRFTATGAETAVVPALGYAEPCDDDATVAYTTEDGTRLADVWAAPEDETVLPAKLLSRSPDGRWLLLSDEQHAYLARCSVGAKLEELGGPAGVTSAWSPDSEYVVYSDTDRDTLNEPTPKALSAFRAESSASHLALFEAVAADPQVSFEPKSTRFLYVEQTPEDELVYRLADLADPSASLVLPLPSGIGDPSINNILVFTSWLGTTGRLSFDTSESDIPGTYVIDATPAAEPRLVRAYSFDDLKFSEDGTRATWIESGDGSAGALSQAYTLDLTRSDSLPHALFADPMTGDLSLDAATLITRFSQTDASSLELYAVPPDFESEPVRINRRKFVLFPTLQPRP